MALPQGLNFRSTSTYVTDPTNFDVEVTTLTLYPRTTPQGNTVGYESALSLIDMRNRSASNDPRLAGIHFAKTSSYVTYRIDLPSAGDYSIRLAMGDQASGWDVKCELIDDATSLGVICNGATGGNNRFRDATDVARTAADWVANNAPITKTFASTICRFKFGNGTSISPWASLYIEAASGGGSHTLVGANSTQANTSSTGTITQIHSLVGANSTQANISSSVSIGGEHTLVAANSAQLNVSSAGVVTQAHLLWGANSTQDNLSSSVALVAPNEHNLVADNCVQATLSSSVTVTQLHQLVAASAVQANKSSSVSLPTNGGTVNIDEIIMALVKNPKFLGMLEVMMS